ncbi:MAG: hypothetical protein RIC55_02655 [Pirellulaceae bacterium]
MPQTTFPAGTSSPQLGHGRPSAFSCVADAEGAGVLVELAESGADAAAVCEFAVCEFAVCEFTVCEFTVCEVTRPDGAGIVNSPVHLGHFTFLPASAGLALNRWPQRQATSIDMLRPYT